MQHNYDDMYYNHANMPDNYVNMWFKLCCVITDVGTNKSHVNIMTYFILHIGGRSRSLPEQILQMKFELREQFQRQKT